MALKYERPTLTLARELEDVARDAQAITEFLRSPNAVPSSFPTTQLLEVCQTLAALPNGSAEGCRTPLEYARVRLPAVRREHVLNEDHLDESVDVDDIPPLLRGMTMDRMLRDLIASVATALDEYRRLASEIFDDTVGPEPLADVSGDTTVVQAVTESENVEAHLQATITDVEAIVSPNSKTADSFIRQARDAEGLNRLARAELRMRAVVVRWYNSIVRKLQNYPNLLKDTGNLIEVGVDIAEPLVHRWHEFWQNADKLLLNELRALGGTLTKIGNNLENRRTSKKPPLPREVVDAPSLNAEREARRLILSGRPVPASIASLVRRLNLSGSQQAPSQIPNPAVLGTVSHTVDLDLRHTNLVDLSPLEAFDELTDLRISSPVLRNLAPIGSLSNLSSLYLSTHNAADPSPISKLSNLKRLTFLDDSVTDISSFEKLDQLTYLRLVANKATDLSSIGKLSNLKILMFTCPKLTDVSFLTNLQNLTSIKFLASSVVELAPLSDLHNLETLVIFALNDAASVPNLSNLENLQTLSLQCSNFGELKSIAKLNKLTSLTLHCRNLVNIAPLSALKQLTALSIYSTIATDLRPIGDLTNLTSLKVHLNKGTDISAIGNLGELRSLSVFTTSAIDLSPLAKLKNLESLILRVGSPVNIEPVRNLQRLQSFDLRDAIVRDWSPVAHVPNVFR